MHVTVGLLGLLYASFISASVIVIEGSVFDTQTDKQLYQEYHVIDGAGHRVTYQDNEQRTFATKSLLTRESAFRAKTAFTSQRCGENYQVTPLGKGKEKDTLLISYRNHCDKRAEKKRITIEKPYVIDAGFSPYIAERLTVLEKTSVSFFYPVPARQKAVQLSARGISCARVADVFVSLLQANKMKPVRQEGWRYCVVVKPASWLLAQFFPPIYLAYDQNKFLMFYAGRSNMSDDENKYSDIAIFYQAISVSPKKEKK